MAVGGGGKVDDKYRRNSAGTGDDVQGGGSDGDALWWRGLGSDVCDA